MIIKTYVDISQEVEVEVSLDDIVSALNNDVEIESRHGRSGAINIAHGIIKRIPDSVISGFSETQRKMIRDSLIAQAERFVEK